MLGIYSLIFIYQQFTNKRLSYNIFVLPNYLQKVCQKDGIILRKFMSITK